MLTKMLQYAKDLQAIQKEIKRSMTPEEKAAYVEYRKIKAIFSKMDRKSRNTTLENLKDLHEFLSIMDIMDDFWKNNEQEEDN